MKIGIDIDDTITNSYPIVMLEFSKLCSFDYNKALENALSYYDVMDRYPSFFKEENFILENVLADIPLKENAKEVINKLYDEGYSIYFITARNKKEYHDPYVFSKNYLDKNGIKYTKLYTEVFEKAKFCLENDIDILIEDSTKHLGECKSLGVNGLTIDNKFNKNFNEFKRIYDWNEVYDYIKSL